MSSVFHQVDKLYPCPLCGKPFRSAQSRWQHKQRCKKKQEKLLQQKLAESNNGDDLIDTSKNGNQDIDNNLPADGATSSGTGGLDSNGQMKKPRKKRRSASAYVTIPAQADKILLYEQIIPINIATSVLKTEEQWVCNICSFKNKIFPDICSMCLSNRDNKLNNFFVYTNDSMTKKYEPFKPKDDMKKRNSKKKKQNNKQVVVASSVATLGTPGAAENDDGEDNNNNNNNTTNQTTSKASPPPPPPLFTINKSSRIFSYNNKEIIANTNKMLGIKQGRGLKRKRSGRNKNWVPPERKKNSM